MTPRVVGSYALALMFRMIAALLGVASFATLLYIALSNEDVEEIARICGAVLTTSALFFILQVLSGGFLKPAGRFFAARRLFGGGTTAAAGLMTLAALLALMIVLFQKPPDDSTEELFPNPRVQSEVDARSEMKKAFGSWLFCFGVFYVAMSWRMSRDARPDVVPL